MPYTFILLLLGACSASKEDSILSIIPNSEGSVPAFSKFDRKVEIFELHVYAESGVRDAQLVHAATILAELLDNNEDGMVDDTSLHTQLKHAQACIPIFAHEGSEAEHTMFDHYDGSGVGAVLYAQEVDEHNPGRWGYDASVEEIMHTINAVGHVSVYPAAFGLEPNSSLLTAAMDIARGGQFEDMPAHYPEESWFHYDDDTCDYACMAIEYMYWAQVSWMGLLSETEICTGISNEWELCTPQLFEEYDTAMHSIITSAQYTLPQVAPDGVYHPAHH